MAWSAFKVNEMRNAMLDPKAMAAATWLGVISQGAEQTKFLNQSLCENNLGLCSKDSDLPSNEGSIKEINLSAS